MNFNGWGLFSEAAYILAAGVAQRPEPPAYLWSSATHIAFQLNPTLDDGGAPITAYELYIDSIQVTPAFVLASSDLAMTRTIEYAPPAAATPGEVAAWEAAQAGTISATLVAGGHYRLVVRAVNQIGTSAASAELRVALAGLPSQPAPPFKAETGSTESSLMIEWDEAAAVGGVEIQGYTLYVDDGRQGDLRPIYDGRKFPLTRRFLVTNLTTGLPYRLSVSTHTVNGESPQSAPATVYACLRPSGLEAPRITSTTRTSIGVAWNEPQANGCPLIGFTLLRNTGAEDPLTVSVDPLTLQTGASLREHLITGLTAASATYKIKIRAHNHAGDVDSPPTVVVLAAVPDTPAGAPSSAAAITDGTRIGVVYEPLAASENGGSDVLSYELQMDDGGGGPYAPLVGSEAQGDSLATQYTYGAGVVEGGLYRFRYRARNVNGWSGFSPVAYIRAASRPGRPDAPVRDSVDAVGFTVTLRRTPDDGGGAILRYELWRNQGTGTADFIIVATYDG